MNTQTKVSNTVQEDEIDLIELFFYYVSKAKIIICALVLGAVIAGGYTYFGITPKYTATSKLYMVSASSDSVVNLTDLNLGTSLSEDYEILMKIRPIAEDVIDELDLDYTYEELLDMVTVSPIDSTRILSISVESTDPKEAKDIANLMADKAVTYLPKLMETSAPNIAETAILPQEKSSPNLTKNTLIGALVGMILAMGVYTVLFLMDDALNSPEDVEKAFGIMPLSVIPEGKMNDKSSKEKRKKG